MKIYISTDFEGVAGIVDWDQIMVGSHDYELGRRLLLGELNGLDALVVASGRALRPVAGASRPATARASGR